MKAMSPVDTPVMGTLGYHGREGKHNITSFGRAQFIKFADMRLKKK